MNKKNKSPLVLCIMDGWGLSNETKYNSVHLAKTPNFDKLLKTYPSVSYTHLTLPTMFEV